MLRASEMESDGGVTGKETQAIDVDANPQIDWRIGVSIGCAVYRVNEQKRRRNGSEPPELSLFKRSRRPSYCGLA